MCLRSTRHFRGWPTSTRAKAKSWSCVISGGSPLRRLPTCSQCRRSPSSASGSRPRPGSSASSTSGTAMRPERWRQIDTILGAALEREPGQRDAFLSEACAGDATLRREVDSLLAAAQRTSDLETPPADVAASLVAEQSARSIPGRNIGRYVVLARVGEGGMGVVYAAYDPELDRK